MYAVISLLAILSLSAFSGTGFTTGESELAVETTERAAA
jgi:hypothetical protein